jgi:hypothetical protein
MPSAATRVAGLLPTLSAQTRAELEPFFRRPNEPGSWLELSTIDPGIDAAPMERGPNDPTSATDYGDHLAIQWHVVPAANGKVKVWAQLRYPGDSLKAEQLALAITNPIWPTLTGLFWDPARDGSLPNNGGGPEFDIYLLHSANPVSAGIAWHGALPQAQPGNECVNSPRMMYMDEYGRSLSGRWPARQREGTGGREPADGRDRAQPSSSWRQLCAVRLDPSGHFGLGRTPGLPGRAIRAGPLPAVPGLPRAVPRCR